MTPVTPSTQASKTTPHPRPRKIETAKLPCYVFETPSRLARHVAQLVASVIQERNSLGQNAVLALPSGSTPVGVYRELIGMHQRGELDFSNVVTFNLDEYYGLRSDQLQSYHRWMREHFFDHVNIPPENMHIPDGSVPLEEVTEHCRRYEAISKTPAASTSRCLGLAVTDTSASTNRSASATAALGFARWTR